MRYNLLHNSTDNIVADFNLELLQEKVQTIPNAIHYTIKRYRKPAQWNYTNAGQFNYHFAATNEANNYVELKFCVVMEDYCKEKKQSCDFCKHLTSTSCKELIPTVDFINITVTKNHLKQFFSPKQQHNLVEDVMQFKHPQSFATSMLIEDKTANLLQNILNHTYTGSFENIYFNAQTQMLLLYSFASITGQQLEQPVFTCKFLTTETEREKITKAREILIAQIGEPLTIKALSRKVAINECYLKKGFKELYGQTIFDFYQSQRMEHAKYLLYSEGLTVTDVADKLGYSSISHFSTAFKKLTGIKPCELLLR